jgi:hypothetical protein
VPEQRILSGYNITVLKLPPSGMTGGQPGVSLVLTEMQPPHNSIVFTIAEEVAKTVAQEMLGIGSKVETASPEEMQAILAQRPQGSGRNN